MIDGNLKSVEYVSRLSTIHVPTLVIAGDHDLTGPELEMEIHDHIPGAELKILPESGHMNFMDQPEMYLQTVSRFLTK